MSLIVEADRQEGCIPAVGSYFGSLGYLPSVPREKVCGPCRVKGTPNTLVDVIVLVDRVNKESFFGVTIDADGLPRCVPSNSWDRIVEEEHDTTGILVDR